MFESLQAVDYIKTAHDAGQNKGVVALIFLDHLSFADVLQDQEYRYRAHHSGIGKISSFLFADA
jgi:hypothetical protein